MQRIILIACLVAFAAATEVSQCDNGEPAAIAVRVDGCEKQPCAIVKGQPIRFEIDFVAGFNARSITTNVRAKVFGIWVNYPLEDDQKLACDMLMYGSYCPLYRGEDVTYVFLFDVGTYYPEIGVTIEISLKDDDLKPITCFKTDIQVFAPKPLK